MADKKLIWIGATIGSIAGAYIPALWGDTNLISIPSFLLGSIGAIAGIIASYRVSRSLS